MRDLIKHIVFEEFSKLTTLIEKDFCTRCCRDIRPRRA